MLVPLVQVITRTVVPNGLSNLHRKLRVNNTRRESNMRDYLYVNKTDTVQCV